ncbi:excinuclease ABC subunit UvrA [Nocardia amamiensis]|uniref:UvrABC system protein A n=1 Tax=Nocardia amamiensis TaxID=404578 RepID=A0ABS0D0Y1_9NOCA|nr:excinuclease ABC subunit UvrA [Nocardia amamiensis]MBF6302479.1 excinuclease ABC subunit UvrA [Nocardia amamiensis]
MHADRDTIRIIGARENNLRDVSLTIPKGRIVVFTGVSGSGKSSVVFGTVAVESQRQLNETFTWFIRNRLPKYERPEADVIDNLAPAVVVDQKPIGGNSRSTVGTMTDIQSVIRVLFSRHGVPSAGEATRYSFNDPLGMCPACGGLGHVVRPDLDKLVDPGKSLNEGAITFAPFAIGTFQWQLYAESGLFDPDKPLREFTPEEWHLFLHGNGFRVPRRNRNGSAGNNAYEGLLERVERLYIKRDLTALSDKNRAAAQAVVTEEICPDCGGARLNAAALASRIDGLGIADYGRLEITDLIEVLAAIDDPVAEPIASAAIARLRRIEEVGLGYLSLDRETSTLSGGEAQRLKVVRHLGSSLTGMTYIFDEPSVGMHPRDVGRLNNLLIRLRDKGNTVLVVEHSPDVIAVADHVIDMGPGAGSHGGRVVFEGTVEALRRAGTSTGERLRRVRRVKEHPRRPTGWLTVTDVDTHNLKNLTARFPTGVLTAVTGVAGSGKSTLVSGAFVAAHPQVIAVDQAAIAASRRSSPATYLGMMDPLRQLFAKRHGVRPGMFSFNSDGACDECGGAGVIFTDLAYMDPVTTVCQICHGRRYRPEVLAYEIRGASIADVLEMTAEEALDFWDERDDQRIRMPLRSLLDVGLGYLTLGRSLSSLSGGERQRIKLADHLHRRGEVYVLDEPTTGLHMADVDILVALLDRLVDAGNTVIVIEHDLDVVARADWVIDLGPDGGKHGGEIVFAGTPSALLADGRSITADYLRRSVGACAEIRETAGPAAAS